MLFISCKDDVKRVAEAPLIAEKRLSATDMAISSQIDEAVHTNPHVLTDSAEISVFNLTSNQQVFSLNDTISVIPASCMKIPTALAALSQLGINHKLYEALMIKGEIVGDTLRGNLLLKADCDPLLESFDVLIKQFQHTGIHHIEGNVYVALEKEDALRAHPTAKAWDIVYRKLPLLLKGKKFVANTLIYSLRAAGITYRRNNSISPKEKAYRQVAITAHKLTDIITPMLIHSSNIKAEALLHHIDSKAKLIKNHEMRYQEHMHATDIFIDNSFFNEIDETKRIDGSIARRSQIHIEDGSGLSPDNRLTARFLVELLKYAYKNEKIKKYLINEALTTPNVPERMGSFQRRLGKPEYTGRVFSKTGTLSSMGSSSLAGYIKGDNNEWYAFAIINSNTSILEAKPYQDKILKIIIKGK